MITGLSKKRCDLDVVEVMRIVLGTWTRQSQQTMFNPHVLAMQNDIQPKVARLHKCLETGLQIPLKESLPGRCQSRLRVPRLRSAFLA